MAWHSGQQLQGGKYTIERVLGLGGAGITYLARQQNARRDEEWVVIKTLKDELRLDPRWAKYQTRLQQDFLNEALKLARCRHPHVVQVKELIREETPEGTIDGMVMEYVRGISLAEHLGQGKLPETEAFQYIRQIGEALTVVHSMELLHRDVKPQNIMLRDGTSEAILIDFGLAREFMPDLTQTHTESRTEGFAPLEQYDRRAKRGAYTDVYALAATLYCLLTGVVPRSAPSRSAGTPLEPPKQYNPTISERTNRAILKGLKLRANDRPQSMQDWLGLLEEPLVQPPKKDDIHQRPIAGYQESGGRESRTTSWRNLAFVLLVPVVYIAVGIFLAAISASLWSAAVAMVGSAAVAMVVAWDIGASDGTSTEERAANVAVFAITIESLATNKFRFLDVLSWVRVAGLIGVALSMVIAMTAAGDKLLKFFRRSHTFIILTGTSLAGLSLGWLIGTMLRSSYP